MIWFAKSVKEHMVSFIKRIENPVRFLFLFLKLLFASIDNSPFALKMIRLENADEGTPSTGFHFFIHVL